MYICNICGGTNVTEVEGMLICTNCGNVIDDDLFRVDYREGGWIERFKLDRREEKRFLRIAKIIDSIKESGLISGDIARSSKEIIRNIIGGIKARTPPIPIALAAIYIAIRELGYSINLIELRRNVEYLFDVRIKPSSVLRYMYIIRLMYRGKPRNSNHPSILAKTTLRKLALRKGFTISHPRIKEMMENIDELYNKMEIFRIGKRPETIAALLIYLADIRTANTYDGSTLFTQKEITDELKISKYTLRDRLRDLIPYRERLKYSYRNRYRVN